MSLCLLLGISLSLKAFGFHQLPSKMCVGENGAPYAELYANAQLEALWKNARTCVEKHGNNLKPSDKQSTSCSLRRSRYADSSFQSTPLRWPLTTMARTVPVAKLRGTT